MRQFQYLYRRLIKNAIAFTPRFQNVKNPSRILMVLPPAFAACYYYQKQKSELIITAAVTKEFDSKLWMADPVTDKKVLLADGSYCGKMERLCMQIQSQFCHFLEEHESDKKMLVDKWYRKAGDGGGISCILENGATFERAGVNISVMRSTLSDKIVQMMRARVKHDGLKPGLPFFVCGVSCVIHPRNPHVPSMHFNFRYFEVSLGKGEVIWWFGGGTDLTPYYLEVEDAKHFHKTLKNACDKHNPEYYPKFKKWCDEYFRIPHRGESRGVGGIFFDDLDQPNQKAVFDFVKAAAESVLPAFKPIVERRKNQFYTSKDREWQLIRRGRYVEFNLVYDRGTKFGLYTKDARIESILMSLPLTANWRYYHDPSKDVRQATLTEVLKNPKDWV